MVGHSGLHDGANHTVIVQKALQLNINRFDFAIGIKCIGAIFTAKTGMFRPTKWQARWQ